MVAATNNGSPQKPGVTVKLGNTTLKSGTDYTVTYSNNTKTGTKAVAKITGKGSSIEHYRFGIVFSVLRLSI